MDFLNDKFKLICLFFILSILNSCQNGYEKIDDKWYYVTINEGSGITKEKLIVDKNTFEILENSDYAKDKDSVYFKGSIIEGAHSNSFKTIGNSTYSLDKNNVYIFWYLIPDADVNTFEILEFPYAKDKRRLYCGNLSINFNKIYSFDLLENNGYSTFDSSIFKIDYPKLYNKIKLKSKAVVYGDAAALINGKKYKGLEPLD